MKKTKAILKPLKKLSADFCGTCELRQLPKGTYFRTLDKNGKMSRETYTKGYYERSEKNLSATNILIFGATVAP